jgi:cell division FtsZ-interacting protein ZapD
MKTDNLLRIEQFCEKYNVEFTFINSLQEIGLLEIIIIEDSQYLSSDDLKELEKLINLHYNLGINIEGIEVISNLLKQVDDLQQALIIAKNKLKFHEME